MSGHKIAVSKRERDIIVYALAFYAARLEEADRGRPYTGPLETVPEVRDLGRRINGLPLEATG